MKKEILNELDQMKYLFGYKAGKVISEQEKPAPVVVGGSKEETPFFTDPSGVVYRFPGITDQAKLDKFVSIGNPQEFVASMGIDQGWLNNYLRGREQNKANAQNMADFSKKDKLWNLWNGTSNLMYKIAQMGLTPEKLKQKGFQISLLGLPAGQMVKFAITDPSGESGVVMTQENFFNKLTELVNKKMSELTA
jgi:hypothetical protein